MKRDMDLVRRILFEIEQHPYDRDSFELDIPEHSQAEIGYHIMLMHQAHLIVAEDRSYEQLCDASGWKPVALTWSGHEFLSAAENDGTWNKAKSLIVEKGSGMVFEILKTLLIEIGKRATLAAI
jgi:hypothetical protein